MSNEGDGIEWEEKLARYHELGVTELLRFDPDPAEARDEEALPLKGSGSHEVIGDDHAQIGALHAEISALHAEISALHVEIGDVHVEIGDAHAEIGDARRLRGPHPRRDRR